VYSGHLLGVEAFGDVLLIGDVVVEVSTPGLDRAHVEVEVGALGPLRLLARVALPEETSGPSVVEGTLQNFFLHLVQIFASVLAKFIYHVLSLEGVPLDPDGQPVVRTESDGEESHRGKTRKCGEGQRHGAAETHPHQTNKQTNKQTH